MPGPIPKRSEERMRRNEPERPIIKSTPDNDTTPFDIDWSPKPSVTPNVVEAAAKWHPLATELYDSIKRSPESQWMTSAGWAVVVLGCEQLSRELKQQPIGINPETGLAVMATVPMKGASFSAHLKLWASLGLMEADRRKMGREITLHQAITDAEGDNVTDIATAREKALGG